MKKFRILTVVGARPQIIKSSAISRAVKDNFSNEIDEIIVHTGQHYDEIMSGIFFNELAIPVPAYNLHAGSASHAIQTAKMMEGLQNVYEKEKPDAVLVYGDTNSTLAAALTASKIEIPIVHVEAGLRSFDKNMPEEINRILCDHVSTLLFTPTIKGLENLKLEGFNFNHKEKAQLNHPKIFHCGDIMLDNSLHFASISDQKSNILSALNLMQHEFCLATIHRDYNTDISENLLKIFLELIQLIKEYDITVVLPLHPRTKAKLTDLNAEIVQQISANSRLKIINPVGYLDMIALEKNARIIITDSGGIQKEAFFFKKPCIILRKETEWVELVENGNALLTGDNYPIFECVGKMLSKKKFSYPDLFGDGKAAEFICKTILDELA